jgi:hypothetical protein
MLELSAPTDSGVMISYVAACLSMPCWWMPRPVRTAMRHDFSWPTRARRARGCPTRVQTRSLRRWPCWPARGGGEQQQGVREVRLSPPAPARCRPAEGRCWLAGLHGDAGVRRNHLGRAHDLLRLDVAVDREEVRPRAQRHDNLLEGCVARALAQRVEGHLDLPRACSHRSGEERRRAPLGRAAPLLVRRLARLRRASLQSRGRGRCGSGWTR